MSNTMQQPSRQTLATSPAKPAPLRIILLSLPLWAVSLGLMLFMPFTAFFSFILIAVCLCWLPFKAKRGACPECQTFKTFPFSGFGSACKGCAYELVLRGTEIHQLKKKTGMRYGSGRSNMHRGKL